MITLLIIMCIIFLLSNVGMYRIMKQQEECTQYWYDEYTQLRKDYFKLFEKVVEQEEWLNKTL
jgi:hypothetical protein